jgi:glycine oxidase
MNIRIIGGGIAGLTCAFMFSKAGCLVSVFERQSQVGKGCSSYAGGMLAPWCELESAESLVCEWGQESLEFWKKEFPDTQSFGSLIVAPNRDLAELKRFSRRTREFEWLDNAKITELEPDLEGRFENALYFKKEGHLDPRHTIEVLSTRLLHEFNVKFHYNATIQEADFIDPDYDWTIDCRGFAAHSALKDLRGVKGEMIILKSDDIAFKRPIRLLHPRFPVYIVPRDNGLFMLGATMVENSEAGRVTARSVMELLNAAYALHPAFGEAEIVEMGCDLRPSFTDNLPSIVRGAANILHVNGLYRHGFLLAPALAKRAVNIALSGADCF